MDHPEPLLPSSVLFFSCLILILCMHLLSGGTGPVKVLLLLLPVFSVLILFGSQGLILSLALFLVLAGFFWRMEQTGTDYLPFPEDRIILLEGEVSDDPCWVGNRTLCLTVLTTRVSTKEGSSAPSRGQVKVYQRFREEEKPSSVGRGALVQVSGSFSARDNSSDLLCFKGSSIKHKKSCKTSVLRILLLEKIAEKSGALNDMTGILLPALILGIDHPRKGEISRLFRESGTAHIMALSGFHAGLIGLLLFMIGRCLFGLRGGYIVSMAGLLFYLWLAGPRPSLVRAVLMYMIFGWGKIFCRNYQGLAVLVFSYLITALVSPYSIQSLSSQLSYLALGGILMTGSRCNILLGSSFPRWFRLPLSASLGAQLWTTGLVLIVFGKTYPAGIIASLFLTPLVTLYIYAGLLWLVCPAFPFISVIFSSFMGGVEKTLLICGECFSRFKPVEAVISSPGPFLLFLIPVLLLEFYSPGSFHGKRKAGFKLRFHHRDKSPTGSDGIGTP